MPCTGIINLNSCSIFIVCKQTSTDTAFTGEGILCGKTSGYDNVNSSAFAFTGPDGTNEFTYTTQNTSISNSVTNTPLPFGLYEVIIDNSVGSMYNNGVQVGSNTTFPTNTASTGFVLGSRWTGGNADTSNGFNGSINEVIIFNRAISIDERIQVENYLMKKWLINNN
jgi:hypothetical protein